MSVEYSPDTEPAELQVLSRYLLAGDLERRIFPTGRQAALLRTFPAPYRHPPMSIRHGPANVAYCWRWRRA
jgi:hypothetical protein